jgi:hypothetical protein
MKPAERASRDAVKDVDQAAGGADIAVYVGAPTMLHAHKPMYVPGALYQRPASR